MANGNNGEGKPNQDRLVAAVVFGAVGIAAAVFFGMNPSGTLRALEGEPVPPIEFRTSAGESLSLAAFRGMPLLINFWATWCAPCMEEMPDLARLEEKLEGKLKVLAFNVDETEEQFLALKPDSRFPKHLIFRFERAQLDAYRFSGVPVSYIVGADGLVKKVYAGQFRWARPDIVRQIEGLIR